MMTMRLFILNCWRLYVFIIASSPLTLATWTVNDDGLRCNDNSLQKTNKYVDFLKHFQRDLKIIHGSDLVRNAFRLNENSYLSMTTSDIFPEGLPEQFSFSCTFRDHQPITSPWSLLNIDDFMGNSLFSLKIFSNENLIEIDFSDSKTLKFQQVKFYQNDWNKIDISFNSSSITLFVNCHKHDNTQFVDWIPELDLDGDITLCNAASIDIQSMSLDCDATRPQREKCDEIIRTVPKVQYKPVEHKTVEIVKECCEPDRHKIKLLIFDVLNDNLDYFAAYFRGNQGKPGIGLPGPVGPKGEPGRCFAGEKGERGEKGSKGDIGFPGEKGNIGSQGPRGMPGATIVGPKGEKGMPGHSIIGQQTRDGLCNKCNKLGLENLKQFMLFPNQHQTKGPPKIIFKKLI